MITYPDDQKVIESMARLRHDKDFIRILEYLEAECIDVSARAMLMDGIEVARMQGAYLTIEEFLSTCKGAKDVIEAAHDRAKKPRTRIP
jgi:hypothetical protein